MLRRAAGVISGKAISRFLIAIGRLGRSKFTAHPPSRAPARTARSNGIARSAAVTAVMPVYSMRALTGPNCLAISKLERSFQPSSSQPARLVVCPQCVRDPHRVRTNSVLHEIPTNVFKIAAEQRPRTRVDPRIDCLRKVDRDDSILPVKQVVRRQVAMHEM